MQVPRLFILALAASAMGLLANVARADDRAMAQRLFEEGKRLLAAGETAEACQKLDAAAQLSPTPGVRLNLSDCYAKLGRVASAWTKADEALALAERAGDKAAARLARRRRDALEPRLSHLTISVPKESVVPGLEVTLDGEALPAAAWGTPLPMDPGDHEIRASAAGRKAWSSKTTVSSDGVTVSVSLPELTPEIPDASPPVVKAERKPSATEKSGGGLGAQRTVALVAGGVGVVGLGVGTIFGLQSRSKHDEAEQFCSGSQCWDQRGIDLSDEARSAGNVSTVAFAAGSAMLAGAAVLWLTAPDAKAAVGSNGRDIVVVGRF